MVSERATLPEHPYYYVQRLHGARRLSRGRDRHEFTELTQFDRAMRKIAGTPKAEVDRREAAAPEAAEPEEIAMPAMNGEIEIRGTAKAVIVCTLAGITLGAIGGCFYGYALERAAIAEEIRQDVKAGRMNWPADGQHPNVKLTSYIASESRKKGLLVGIPLGTVVGLVAGVACAVESKFRSR